MWNPKKIEIYNFFSHKESIYNFKENQCVVIFGQNQTDRNLENNGAGKTTLFEAIYIALTNESLRDIKKESFINREEEWAKICLDLYNPVLNFNLRIERIFYRGSKSTSVLIYENGVLNNQITSVNEANKHIFSLIGLSKEDIERYFIISQDSRYTFFTASDVEKKEIINRITSASMINPVINSLAFTLKEKTNDLRDLESEKIKVISKMELLNEQLQNAIANADIEDELNEIKVEILKCQESIKDFEKKIKSKKIKIKKNQEQYDEEVEVLNAFTEKKNKIKKVIKNIELEISESETFKRKISLELEGAVVCPKCFHKFIAFDEFEQNVEEKEGSLPALEGLIEQLQKDKEKQEKVLKREVQKETEKSQEIEDLKENLFSDKREVKNWEFEISNNEKNIELLNKRKKKIESEKDNNIITSLKESIKKCEKEMRDIEEKIKPLSQEIDMIRFWQVNMGKLGFMTYLANKSIKVIEGATNSFLKKFGVDISVVVNGFKILKSGEAREKIDIFVNNDGFTSESFLSKSGGERGRVNLAGILALHQLINQSTNGKGLNLICFDECFYGMDSKGQENIIKIFEKMKITILVITQNVSESFNNENTLLVVKNQGVSKYIQ